MVDVKWYHRFIPTKVGLGFYLGTMVVPYPLSLMSYEFARTVSGETGLSTLEGIVSFLTPQLLMYAGARAIEFSWLYRKKKYGDTHIDMLDDLRTRSYFGTLFVDHRTGESGEDKV